jgi:WG repeat protein
MSVFWQALTILLFFEVPSVAQVSVPPTLSHREIENTPLKPVEQDEKWGYVDLAGKFIIAPQFESADPFSEGVAAVELNKRFGYVGTDGHFVIQPRYFRAGLFREGFAWVVTRKPSTPLGTGEYGFALFGQVTYIDHSGREVRHPFSAEHVSNFSDGLAAVRPGKIFGGCSERVGYLNTKGEWSIKPQFDEAHDFSEGLAAVNQGGKCHMGGKWGYIDKDGTLVIPYRYDFAGQFTNGHACVAEAEHWNLIDTKGNGIPVEKNECVR